MSDAVLSTALSGMLAAVRRVGAVAENTANAGNVSRLNPRDGDPPAFEPVLVAQSAQPRGGVRSELRSVDPASITVPDNASPFADTNGLVSLPNVDLGQQRIDALSAQRSFEANLKMIQVAQDMQDTLLNLKT